MSRIIAAGLLCLCLTLGWAGASIAHTLFMNVDDTGENTVFIEGVYSTGALAAFTTVRLVDEAGAVIWEGKTDAQGQAEVTKPDVPYTIILDGGPGHVVENPGP